MIRISQPKDLGQIMAIWLNGNIQAHPHNPPDYWQQLYEPVKTMLPQADIYVYADKNVVKGFIGVIENSYIAGLFVDEQWQHQGIGKALLKHVQSLSDNLSLTVYQTNENAIRFYQHNQFTIEQSQLNQDDQQPEYVMIWHNGTK